MSALATFLRRLALDDAFRDRFVEDPQACMAPYALSEQDRATLSTPSLDWLGLLARVLREHEVPEGPAWDPDQVLPEPAAPAAAAGPSSAFAGLPEARLLIRLAPSQHPDGRAAWAASLQVEPTVPVPPEPDAVLLRLRVRPDAGSVSVDLAPIGVEPEPEPSTAPIDAWDHRTTGPAVLRAAARARSGEIEDLLDLLSAVTGTDPTTDAATPASTAPAGSPQDPVAPAPPAAAWRTSRSMEAVSLGDGLARADVTVVGLGLRGVDHVTQQGRAALRRAHEVLYVDTGVATGTWLESLCERVTPLFSQTYAGGSPRLDTYHLIAARVLQAAVRRAPVCLVVQGHPTVYSYVPLLLHATAPTLGLRVQIQPGISAEAAILAALGIDPCDHGLQSYEATDLLLRRRPLQPDVATLLWQVGGVETRLHSARRSVPARFERLTAWLLRFYGPDHPVTAVRIGVFPGVPSVARTVPLADLPSAAPYLDAATTLYLPPIGRRAIRDVELMRQLDDPVHLARITGL